MRSLAMKAHYTKCKPAHCCFDHYDGSVHDDTDTFTMLLLDGLQKEDFSITYFFPKLSEEELKLVKDKNKDHLRTYSYYHCEGLDPDVPKEEMAKSKSKSKYVACEGSRITVHLNLDDIENKLFMTLDD